MCTTPRRQKEQTFTNPTVLRTDGIQMQRVFLHRIPMKNGNANFMWILKEKKKGLKAQTLDSCPLPFTDL